MPSTASKNGFTLVELLLVVSIIAVLSSFLIPGFSNYIDNQNVLQASEILKSDLRSAQSKALTGVGAYSSGILYWGIKIPSDNATSYIFFNSTANDATACTNAVADTTSENLPGGVVIKGANGACIFFSVENGNANFVNTTGSLDVGRVSEAACFAVAVNSVGMIRGVDLCP